MSALGMHVLRVAVMSFCVGGVQLSNRPTYGGHIGRATFQVPFHLDRRHVVIALAGSYAVESYLEIGCETDYVFDSMSVSGKTFVYFLSD